MPLRQLARLPRCLVAPGLRGAACFKRAKLLFSRLLLLLDHLRPRIQRVELSSGQPRLRARSHGVARRRLPAPRAPRSSRGCAQARQDFHERTLFALLLDLAQPQHGREWEPKCHGLARQREEALHCLREGVDSSATLVQEVHQAPGQAFDGAIEHRIEPFWYAPMRIRSCERPCEASSSRSARAWPGAPSTRGWASGGSGCRARRWADSGCAGPGSGQG